MHGTRTARHVGHCRRTAALSLVLGLLIVPGCASSRIKAAKLPLELEAPEVVSAHSVDLSKLAMDSPSGERIDTGDVIDVTVAASLNSQDTITFPVRVNEQGGANLPVIGEVPVGGLDLVQAEAAIAATAVQRGLYRSPQVTVTMKQRRMNRVMVAGAVKNPGVYNLPRRSSDMLAAILAGGGLADSAGTKVEIRNPQADAGPAVPDRIAQAGGRVDPATGRAAPVATRTLRPQIITVNLTEAAREATDGYYVEDGGVVMVEKRTPAAIHVFGLVRKPGQYEFPLTHELRVLDAIALGGGTTVSIADKVFIVRKLPNQETPTLIQCSVKKAKQDKTSNIRLAEGDIISVEHDVATGFIETLQVLRLGVGASLNSLF